MSIEENKRLVRRYLEDIWGQGDLDLIDDILAQTFTLINPALPQPVRGREAFKRIVTAFRTGLPDFQTTVEELIAEGDKVVARSSVRGTHLGVLQGVPPTGKQIGYGTIGIFRIADGQIQEVYVISDALGILRQLDVVSAAG
jgi:steroid delta-isomerase-like uncharacterized protein